MERERARRRRREAGERLLAVWGLAIFPNLLAALGFDPEGWAWTAMRVVLTAAFTVALLAFIVTLWQEVRARRSG